MRGATVGRAVCAREVRRAPCAWDVCNGLRCVVDVMPGMCRVPTWLDVRLRFLALEGSDRADAKPKVLNAGGS